MSEKKPDVVESSTLLALAKAHDYHLTSRMLETFRDKHLMPRTERVGYRKGTPIWAYPAGADEQLMDLMRWREYTTDRDLLIQLLWLGGHAIPFEDVRAALVGFFEALATRIEARIDAERTGATGDRSTAVHAVAAELARKQEANSVLPRTVGGTPQQRTEAIATLTGLLLGEPQPLTAALDKSVEATFSLSPPLAESTHAPRWVSGPAKDLFDTLAMFGLPDLRAAATDASEDQWQLMRPIAQTMVLFLPVVATMAKALTGDKKPLTIGLLGGLGDEPNTAPLVMAMVLTQIRESAHADAIKSAAQALLDGHQLATDQLQALLALPTRDQATFAKSLSEPARRALVETLEAHRQSQLGPAPNRKSTHKPSSRRA